MTLAERFVILASCLVSLVAGFVITTHISKEWLGLNIGIALLTAVVGGLVASLIGLLIAFQTFAGPRIVYRVKAMKGADRDAIAAWQRDHTDSVFGSPTIWGEPVLDGKWSERLKQYQGRVIISPPQRFRGPIELFAHIGPRGFTEQQREFYRRLLLNHRPMIESYYPALNAAFRLEFHAQGDFPHTTSIHGLEIGPMNGDQLGESTLTLEYDQDAYVDVGITDEKVTSVHFWM